MPIDEGDQLVRDRDAIDGELRLIAILRRAALEQNGEIPANGRIDKLLDERLLVDSPEGNDAVSRNR